MGTKCWMIRQSSNDGIGTSYATGIRATHLRVSPHFAWLASNRHQRDGDESAEKGATTNSIALAFKAPGSLCKVARRDSRRVSCGMVRRGRVKRNSDSSSLM